jgi:hypothetical protein
VHAFGQEPQCAASVARFTHVPEQSEKPGAQAVPQAPDTQVATSPGPAEHTVPQPPQLRGSLLVGMQALPHFENPDWHVKSQLPPLQTATPLAGTGQAFPQAPQ